MNLVKWSRRLSGKRASGLLPPAPQQRAKSRPEAGSEQRSAGKLAEQLAVVEALYRDAHATALAERAKALWLYRTAVELSAAPRGWDRWLPFWAWQRKLERRLLRKNIFDTANYLFRYPDVGAEGINPIHHYLAHGMNEGRDGGIALLSAPQTEPDLDAIPAIIASGLFDPEWYSAQYGVIGSDQQLVEDYLRTSAQDPLRQPSPLFSGAFYSLEHADTRIINPLVHYVRYGMREGRRAFQSTAADVFMTQATDQTIYTFRDFLEPGKPVIVLYWKDGNFFFTDIAQYVAEVLAGAGFNVRLLDDHRDLAIDDVEIIVVAPHEYCVHGPGTEFTSDIASRVLHVNLEQWHTSWFSLSLDKMLTSRKALDINPLSARGLSRLGIKAGFLPLLPRQGGVFDFGQEPPSKQLTELRAIKPLTYPRRFIERPYDILFVGYLNKRRARSLAQLGHVLSDYDCFLHAPRFTGPITSDSPNMIGSRDLAQIAQNAKLLLNIHQGESHYFEWHRLVVSAIAQGCVPLTEPCAQIGIVEPGEHYIEATLEEMPERIAWLLNTPQGRREIERIHENGQKLMASLSKEMAGHLS
ncbi:hypothetical protein [Novosphingobium pentaromativorans]|uniref:Uncharacterized protein n=1 Tax=Novosphingobium pentaromativorans US6-1 TaxID=1088721 RepID=G6ELG2_9SPHN|nr:hypothetical protein [Novosphingobium pentaromativorans]EHJ57843.1 hypothetical protein NSU_pLA2036 [Novosphingobium pentaromativorans US6-1]